MSASPESKIIKSRKTTHNIHGLFSDSTVHNVMYDNLKITKRLMNGERISVKSFN